MTGPGKSSDFLRQDTQHHLLQEWVHDTYKSKHKLAEPTVCPSCSAVYLKGKWSWSSQPEGAHEATCPACQRIADRVPAGYLTLRGSFLTAHREEILQLARNLEEKEKKEHPLKRIMDIEERADGLLLSFTDPHLAHGVGNAIHHAYRGELNSNYSDSEQILRVDWQRD